MLMAWRKRGQPVDQENKKKKCFQALENGKPYNNFQFLLPNLAYLQFLFQEFVQYFTYICEP